MVSKYKPKTSILAVAHNESTLRLLSLLSGVTPIKGEITSTVEDLFAMSIDACKKAGALKDGDTVVITAGYALYEPGATNLLKIDKV
jgi:pyruvate kinase